MKSVFDILLNMHCTLYLHYQEYPRFKLHRRWKQYKGTFDIALIIFGIWFGINLDHPIFETNGVVKKGGM